MGDTSLTPTGPRTSSHKARYDLGGASTQRISLGPFRLEIDHAPINQSIEVLAGALEDDREVMREIADDLVANVRDHIENGAHLPLTDESQKRRRRAGLGVTPLVATGALLRGITPRSRKGYAAAQRGAAEWYGFLHEFGVGRQEQRAFMYQTDAEMSAVESKYGAWVDSILEAGQA